MSGSPGRYPALPAKPCPLFLCPAQGAEQQASAENEESRRDGAHEATGAEAWRIYVERALTRVCCASRAEHDPERDEVRRGDQDCDGQQDDPAFPAVDPAQPEEQHDEGDQCEREAVEEPEADAVREASVGLIADAVRPPPRHERACGEEDENGESQRDEDRDRPDSVILGPGRCGIRRCHLTSLARHARRSSTAASSTSLNALRPAEAGVRSPVRLKPARS